MPRRSIAAAILAVASAAVLIGATVWAWSTSAYWEGGPIALCVGSAGMLAGLAYWAWRGRFIPALAVAAGVLMTTFIVTLFTSLRWAS